MHAPLHYRRPCTPCHSPLHYAREPAALHSRHPCTPCHSPLHYAPPKCPSLGRGVPPKNHASRRGGNAHERKAPPPSAVAWAKPARAGHPGIAQGRACESTPREGRSVTQGTALRAWAPSVTFRGHSRSVTRAEALRAWAPSVPFRGHSRSVTRAEALRAWAPSVTLRKHKRYVPRGTALHA